MGGWQVVVGYLALLVITVAPVAGAGPVRHPPLRGVTDTPLPPPRPAMPGPPATAAPVSPPAPPAPPAAAPASPPAVSPAQIPPAAPVEPIEACLARLRGAGAVVEAAVLTAPPDPRCTVSDPVKLTALSVAGSRIELPDQPIVACATAQTFADFLADLVVPLAKGTFNAPITSVGTGPGFECRPRNGVAGTKLSAHGQGLAVDIAQFHLGDGRIYKVGEPADDRDRHFDRAVRAGACGYFNTALGPGADEAHANHWHMDLEPRGSHGDSKFCQ
jgi:hypothetical protein